MHHTWNTSANEYNRFEKKWHYYERVAERLVKALPTVSDSNVLELACGTGACTILLSRLAKKGRVTAIERSPAMLKLAKQNVKTARQSNVSFIHGDVRDLSALVRGKKFDVVACNSALWQFPEQENLMRDLYVTLEEGGVLAFNIPIWFRSKKESLDYRKTVDGVLSKHNIDTAEFWRKRRPIDYPSLLSAYAFSVIKDVRYSVDMQVLERKEWRLIPIFARRWGVFRDLPKEVAHEIRREVDLKTRSWPENRDTKSRWRLILARTIR